MAMRAIRLYGVSMLVGLAVLVVPARAGAGPACPKHPAKFAGRRVTLRPNDDAQLACADLRNAVLNGLTMVAFDLHDADLTGASLRHVKLDDADLTGATLDAANLTGAELVQAYLDDTHAVAATFDSADLTQVHLRDANVSGSSFVGVEATQLVARDADLRDTDFTGADLSQADLRGADLHGANFFAANTEQAMRATTDPPINAQTDPRIGTGVPSPSLPGAPEAGPVEPPDTSPDVVWAISAAGLVVAACSALIARRAGRARRRASPYSAARPATTGTLGTPPATTWQPDPGNPAYHVIEEGRRGLFRRR